jgi:hypothetical protein
MMHMPGNLKKDIERAEKVSDTKKSSEDKLRAKIVVEEITYFKNLIAGHRRLLEAIGRL